MHYCTIGMDATHTYKPLPKHPLPADAQEFLASLSPVERKLQELARENLGSSYFMEKTNGYKAWVSKKKGKTG